MAQIIDITKEISKRRLSKVKKELELELERLDFDLEKEINKYVIFDNTNYYEISRTEEKEVASHEKAVQTLLTAFKMLIELDEKEAAIEVENTITRLRNNSY